MGDKELLIFHYEEITEKEIRDAIRTGAPTLEQIKRRTTWP